MKCQVAEPEVMKQLACKLNITLMVQESCPNTAPNDNECCKTHQEAQSSESQIMSNFELSR